jgi:PadR family transcriptional regulator PadR
MNLSDNSSQLRRGAIGPVILALLVDGPAYGLEIVKRLQQEGDILMTEGTVYPLLNRMEAGNLLASEWTLGGGRPRRYYAITRAGRDELLHFSQEWADFKNAVDRILQRSGNTGGEAS